MFVDSHTHHFLSNYATLELLKKEGYSAVYVLAYLPIRPSHPNTLIDLFRWLLDVEPERFGELGIKAYLGVGIHPRNIPYSELTSLLSSMEEWVVRADLIGEIGLEVGSEVEVKVLLEMLKLADKFDKPAIIHTPRRGKEVIIKRLQDILRSSSVQPGRVVVDHASYELIDDFINLGTLVGLTVQPGKLSTNQLINLVIRNPELIERGMINSDCGRDPSNPLAVKTSYEELINAGITASDALKLVRDNALRLINP
ncbi:MAG: TatD family hydrolase [Sulfolobales archaeon]